MSETETDSICRASNGSKRKHRRGRFLEYRRGANVDKTRGEALVEVDELRRVVMVSSNTYQVGQSGVDNGTAVFSV